MFQVATGDNDVMAFAHSQGVKFMGSGGDLGWWNRDALQPGGDSGRDVTSRAEDKGDDGDKGPSCLFEGVKELLMLVAFLVHLFQVAGAASVA